jgi:hypothetical protein
MTEGVLALAVGAERMATVAAVDLQKKEKRGSGHIETFVIFGWAKGARTIITAVIEG